MVDYETDQVVLAVDADQPWYPASLAKLMTIYLAFEALDGGELTRDTQLVASEHAAAQSGSRLGLAKGVALSALDAIQATVLRSANDAAVVLAERLAGSEEAFAERMTERARALGMTATVFRNATGLPDGRQWTTAADMALLARALLRDFPEHFALFSHREMVWKGRRLPNINGLLGSFPGADGLKTGFTCGSGYNIVASALHDGRRLIAVLLGAQSLDARRGEITRLLQAGFSGKVPKEYAMVAKPVAHASLAVPDAEAAAPVKAAIKIKSVMPGGCDAETAHAGTATATASVRGWALSVGNAHQEQEARAMLDSARSALGGDLRGGRPTIVQRHIGALPPYRALVVGYDETRAIATCLKLRRADVHCVVINPEQLSARHAIWN